jgi:anti-anti-sigma factor
VNDENRTASGGIEVSEDETRSLVRLWGDVDASLRDQASMAMIALANRGGPYVVDVSDVTFIDSSGIAFILQVHRMAADEGSTAVLRDPPALVIEMLDLIGIGGTIPFEFTPGHAPDAVPAGSA